MTKNYCTHTNLQSFINKLIPHHHSFGNYKNASLKEKPKAPIKWDETKGWIDLKLKCWITFPFVAFIWCDGWCFLLLLLFVFFIFCFDWSNKCKIYKGKQTKINDSWETMNTKKGFGNVRACICKWFKTENEGSFPALGKKNQSLLL